MMGILDSHIMGRYGLICTPDTNHSEILYIVILTIICVIYTLYVVFVLIWLHLSFIVREACSLDSFKCYSLSVTLYGRLKWLTPILPNLWSKLSIYIPTWVGGPALPYA